MGNMKPPTQKHKKTRKYAVAKSRPAEGAKQALEIALDPDEKAAARIRALSGVVNLLGDSHAFFAVLDLLSDEKLPGRMRYAALSAIQAAAFSVQEFDAYRAKFLARLRRLRRDADPQIRSRVLGILAREHDASTQELLVLGLQDPKAALIAPEKALQLLGNDIHAGIYDIARRIADAPPNQLARREALRILASTTESAGYFEGILRDRAEPTLMRQVAASSLNQLAPQRLLAAARDLAIDDAEDPEVKSLSFTALANFGDRKQLQQDSTLQKHASHLTENPAYQGTALLAAVDTFKRRCNV